MGEFFGNMIINMFVLVCFGAWGIGTLLKKIPTTVKDSATRGAAGLITRFFMGFFR